jgi:predicted RNA-binding protein
MPLAMAHWICVTNSANWKITKEKKLLGAPRRNKNALSRVKPGDKCLIYVMSETVNRAAKPSEITAEYQAISKCFKDGKKIFHPPLNAPNETFSLRIRLKPLRIFKKPVEFKPLIYGLGFIPNKERWGLSFKGRAVIEIPEADYELIISHLES